MNIQLEFALAQKCDLMIMGHSGYGEVVYSHMCCGFPLHDRGAVPQRCICPPRVHISQGGFTCQKGNVMMCSNSHDDKEKNFSNTASTLMPVNESRVSLTPHMPSCKSFLLSEIETPGVIRGLADCATQVYHQACLTSHDSGPRQPLLCQRRGSRASSNATPSTTFVA
jgi:hypothetical protein